MTFPLAPDELALLQRVAEVQEEEVVNFCIDLDIVPEEPFRVEQVVERVVEALAERAGREGLPISKYDIEDLRKFSAAELNTLARGLGLRPNANHGPEQLIATIVKGSRKAHRKLPRRSQIPLMLTYFLPALIRRFAST